MPLDVLGCTRATLTRSTSSPFPIGTGNLLKSCRDGDRSLQLLIFNEEFLVSAVHQTALITSLPFVHTARRSYRLSGPVSNSDCGDPAMASLREVSQTLSLRGRTSRNKASVGEPAEGSFTPAAIVATTLLCADFDPSILENRAHSFLLAEMSEALYTLQVGTPANEALFIEFHSLRL
jgi:hypothetical protein